MITITMDEQVVGTKSTFSVVGDPPLVKPEDIATTEEWKRQQFLAHAIRAQANLWCKEMDEAAKRIFK